MAGRQWSTRDIHLEKREARALLAALDWCDAAFGLGKIQRAVREKVLEVFPEMKEADDGRG